MHATEKQREFLRRLINSNAIPKDVQVKTLELIDTFDGDRVNKGIFYAQKMIRDRNNAIKRVGGIKAIHSELTEYANAYLKKGTPVEDAHWFLLEEAARFVGLEVETLSNQVSEKCFQIARRFASGIVFTDSERERSLKIRNQRIDEKVGVVRQLIESGATIGRLEPYTQKLSEKTLKNHLNTDEWEQYLTLKRNTKEARIEEVKQAHENGMSINEICAVYQIGRTTAWRYLKQ